MGHGATKTVFPRGRVRATLAANGRAVTNGYEAVWVREGRVQPRPRPDEKAIVRTARVKKSGLDSKAGI
jgi:hypothetical protein